MPDQPTAKVPAAANTPVSILPNESETSVQTWRAVFDRLTVDNLVNESPEAFADRIQALPGTLADAKDRSTDDNKQRDQSVRFTWGHDHDFGTFKMQGQMRDRHLWILGLLSTELDLTPDNLAGLKVLDIGCWTGGTSLALAACGADVTGVEEVGMYADCLTSIAHAFGMSDRLRVHRGSLYELREPEFLERFDIVLNAGVIYHITDPVLALRLCFTALKDGGRCFVESAGFESERPEIRYHGAQKLRDIPGFEGVRAGWNWFVPSNTAVRAMMADVGFEQVNAIIPRSGRVTATGVRTKWTDVLRAGLSRPDTP